MKTSKIFVEEFLNRTTGRHAIFTVHNLTLDAVKTVLKGIQIKYGTEEVSDDVENGFLRLQRNSGYHGGNDGYIPTAKGFRAILSELEKIPY